MLIRVVRYLKLNYSIILYKISSGSKGIYLYNLVVTKTQTHSHNEKKQATLIVAMILVYPCTLNSIWLMTLIQLHWSLKIETAYAQPIYLEFTYSSIQAHKFGNFSFVMSLNPNNSAIIIYQQARKWPAMSTSPMLAISSEKCLPISSYCQEFLAILLLLPWP